MSSGQDKSADTTPRRRMPREERHRQLIETAWRIVRDKGTDALSLGRLAQHAGVTKPVVYDHFGTRNGLLAALYREFDVRQTEIMDAALATSDATLASRASVIASSYVDCVLLSGREMPDVIAALAGSPEMERSTVRINHLSSTSAARSDAVCFEGRDRAATLWAMLGAADPVSNAAASGEITAAEAKQNSTRTVVSMVARGFGKLIGVSDGADAAHRLLTAA